MFGNKLVFEYANLYTVGIYTVTVKVANSFAKQETAYSFDFEVRVIDCSLREDYHEFTQKPLVVC